MRLTASRPVMPWTMNVVVGVDQDAHRASPLDRAPRRLVEGHAAVRVGHAVALEDLEALLLPRAGDAEDRDLLGRVVAQLDARLDDAARDDVDARVGDDRHHHRDLVDARLGEHQLGQPARLRDRRVAADLAVVGRPPAVRAHGVEQRQRAAAGADHQPEVAVELGHVAGDAAVVLRVDLLAGQLERGRLACLARLLVADAELAQQRLLARARLVLHVHVRVDGDERAVLELGERVDLRQHHVVLAEQPREPREDRGQAVQRLCRSRRPRRSPAWPRSPRTAAASRSARARRARDGSRRSPRCRSRPCRRRSAPGACGCRPRSRRRSTPA